MNPDLGEVRLELLGHLEVGDRPAAVAVVDRVQAAGLTGAELISGLFGPAMDEVGRRWLDNRWTVAQEHAATGVIDLLLGRLELEPAAVTASSGTVLGVCATGEWHVTPLRMFAEMLRRHGWNVKVLGASVPADHLARHLAERRPLAVVLSCSVARFLAGAAAVVEAAHRSGVPVLAGGAAFGPDERRALAVGADGWALDPAAADAVLRAWVADPPAIVGPGPGAGPPGAGRGALAPRVAALVPGRAARPVAEGLGPVEDLIRDLVLAADAAATCDDPGILAEELRWASRALEARGARPSVVRALAADLARHEPALASTVQAALAGNAET